MSWTGRRAAVVVGVAAISLLSALPVLADPGITAKQAEARQVLAELQQLNSRLGAAVEAYDGATYKLGQIRAQLVVNRGEMTVARHNLRVADSRLARHLRDLYISGGSDSTLEVILGAKSLDDVISRLDTANRVSASDAQVLQAVRTFRGDVARQGAALRKARAAQSRLVAQRAAAKRQIEDGIAQRHQLLSSIKGEIVKLQQQEAARQAVLAAQARARLISERIAQQRALSSVAVGATVQSPGPFGATVVPPSAVGSQVVSIAMRYLGDPYVWGTAGPSTFDCSGLVMYVFGQVGISLPHYAASQWNYGVYVSKDQLQPGDLVFFANLDHVGIYIGGGNYIQAPQTGDVVKITSLSDPWSESAYFGARRIIG
jgi:cell wall-associated NlpC family hydrolase